MIKSPTALFFPVAIMSLINLAMAQANLTMWIIQSIGVICCLLSMVYRTAMGRFLNAKHSAKFLLGVSLILFTFSAFYTPEQSRWLNVFGFNLYTASMLLPSLVFVSVSWINNNRDVSAWMLFSIVALATLLILQPDKSQLIAYLGSLLIAVQLLPMKKRAILSVLMISVMAYSVTLSETYSPVAHVELVFKFAFEAHLLTGICSLAALIALLQIISLLAERAIAISLFTYYLVIFYFSAVGYTPAPVLGYGISPLLGFALLVVISSEQVRSTKSH